MKSRGPKIGKWPNQKNACKCRAKLSRCREFTFNERKICKECLDDGATPESAMLGKPRVRLADPVLNFAGALA